MSRYATKEMFTNSQKPAGSGGGLLGGAGGTMPKSTAYFAGTPQTVFPQYTSGAWANLPTGTLGTPPAPPPTTPAPATPQNPLQNLLGGLFGGGLGQGGGLLGGLFQNQQGNPQQSALLNRLFRRGQP